MRRSNISAPNGAAWVLGALSLLVFALAGCGDQQKAVAERAGEEKNNTAETTKDQGSTSGESRETHESTGPVSVTLPSGTALVASLQNTIDTGKNHVGDPVRLRTLHSAHGVPAGSTIHGEVTHVDPAGRVAGGAELTLRFTELVLPNGKSYAISAVPLRMKGKGEGKESAIEIGGGAVAGGVLGGVLGHGAGDVAKGAVIGAAAGTAVAVATKGDQIVLPAGQRIQVTLAAPVTVTRSPAS